ncbi:5,10-methylenetetrahydrofolate reductase [Ameyamaea chiangmaiensis NBRC 103196]|uniref:Methylenetetrahydrofolate reductase n=1 Tax=Ameyamaea chiangmaiensis TaxID=442969 RepID=A0A850PAZ8_9PROT|nr:methylenetetrahydrofolate reductase [Ameyamaea chiangmaiensis]MBS4074944.1 methylenetetrahydrofolate reductase [Ameyamaea chiangmaiensis]NVN39710.1 methylenetetrahydrofolate reductase [Ameyamaea chiangmaiensis]GBQ63288.1 5,10-methylenetetrahydrofolate reductase [Ameyamaea chiangmaiensis NBRC 103196]
MGRIAVELVPRDADNLLADARMVRDCFPVADTINIPDLLRLPLRSWDAARMVREAGLTGAAVPHVRAIDIAPDGPLPGLDDPDLREILVVRGDPPADLRHTVYPNTAEDVIARYRRAAPHLRIYAAFDPYRRAPYRELEAMRRKRDAGADGFFTQPLFDRKMLDLCLEWLRGESVFWGLSPVIGPKSRSYWETTNHVVFPRDFAPTLDANIAFARETMRTVAAEGGSVYLMPLRVRLERYLPPLLDLG